MTPAEALLKALDDLLGDWTYDGRLSPKEAEQARAEAPAEVLAALAAAGWVVVSKEDIERARVLILSDETSIDYEFVAKLEAMLAARPR